MRKGWIAAILVLCLSVGATAIELNEIGLQIEIGLRPFLERGQPRWDFRVGAYSRLTLTNQYSLRFDAGIGTTPFMPYVDAFLTRPMSEEWTLEGELLIEIIPARSVAATANVGTRLTIGTPPDERWELASFPLGWRLEVANGSIGGDFLLKGNLLLDLTLASPGPLLIGQGIRVGIVRESRRSEPSVISIGSGWALGLDLMTHIGTDF